MNSNTFINSHNKIALSVFEKAMQEYISNKEVIRRCLRNCNAEVYETQKYYILKSYDAFIAAIDKEQNIIVDVLRHEYKFTRTSAMHISKFSYDYLDKIRPSERFTWREMK